MHEWEAATWLLGGGLGVLGLVGGSIWHGDGCAVDDLDVASFPEGAFMGVAFAALGEVLEDGGEGFFGKFGAGFAVAGGLRGSLDLGIGGGGGGPGLEAADNLAAGGIWRKHLSEKGPEENVKAVMASAAVVAFGGGSQEGVWNGVAAEGFEVAQGVGGFKFFEGFGLFRFGTATEKQGAEGGKKRSGVSHETRNAALRMLDIKK